MAPSTTGRTVLDTQITSTLHLDHATLRSRAHTPTSTRTRTHTAALRDAYKKKKLATHKLQLLDELLTELSNKNRQQAYMELRVLEALKLWLDPLDEKNKAGSLPNKTLLLKVLSLLDTLPVDVEVKGKDGQASSHNLDLVNDSEIGHAVSYIHHVFRKDKTCPVFRTADKVHTPASTRTRARTHIRVRTNAYAQDERTHVFRKRTRRAPPSAQVVLCVCLCMCVCALLSLS